MSVQRVGGGRVGASVLVIGQTSSCVRVVYPICVPLCGYFLFSTCLRMVHKSLPSLQKFKKPKLYLAVQFFSYIKV